MLLAICGEGIDNAQIYTSACLAKFPEISNVFSLGVAGSLNHKISSNEIIEARTIYAQNEFKSYQTGQVRSQFDLISSPSRILNKESAQKLSYFADAVDRESYGVAKASSFFKTNFRAIKVISDSPLKKQTNICDFVKEQALIYSDKLLKYYLNSYLPENSIKENSYQIICFIDEHFANSFYFTFTLEKQLNVLEEKLELKGIDRSQIEEVIVSLSKNEKRPKERTLELISCLKDLLNPFEKTFNQKVESILSSLNDQYTKTRINNNLEKITLEMHSKISHPLQLDCLVRRLKNFDWSELDHVFEGKI